MLTTIKNDIRRKDLRCRTKTLDKVLRPKSNRFISSLNDF